MRDTERTAYSQSSDFNCFREDVTPKQMITYTPPKVEILTDRSWGSTPESNMKSIIQALEVCRDSHVAEEDYQKVITKFCFPNQRFDKAGNPMPPHVRLLEFTNFEFEENQTEDSEKWLDIDILTAIQTLLSYNDTQEKKDRFNTTCSLRGFYFSYYYDFLFNPNRCKHVNLPMTHPAKRIMIRIECSSKVGHHLRTHRGVSWCAQAESSISLYTGIIICHSKEEWFNRNLSDFEDMHERYCEHTVAEDMDKVPKKEKIANQNLPTDWLMRPRVGVASRRQWLEMCEQRISDPKTHPETKHVCQMIQDKLEAMGEDG